jgi:hypothetical protein
MRRIARALAAGVGLALATPAGGQQSAWQIQPPSWAIVPGDPRPSPDRAPPPHYAPPPQVQLVPVLPYYAVPPRYALPPGYAPPPQYDHGREQPGPRFPRSANGLGW